MTIEKLKKLNITDSDINWVESILDSVKFDDSRRAIIKNLDSVDIQAFPGSGKTTTLVAKLAILAKKWPFSHFGICVLSHTNAAREEIQDRLGNTDIGKKLLSYPHFIGTLQSFFDTYIGMPWIRSKGIKLNLIDSEIVMKKRWDKIPARFRIMLEKQRIDCFKCEYKDIYGKINLGKISEGTDTYKKILEIISLSQKDGNFTFHEMLLIADKALSENNMLSSIIQNRFPLLFIDEAQDTNTFQWNLIKRAFSNNGTISIRQGFGDSNQAIYNYVEENVETEEFPRLNPLLLSESKRFDSRIANLVNAVSVSDNKMQGSNNEFSERDIKHTIYLFKKEKASDVINEFGKLVIETFSDYEIERYQEKGCHVIGAVHIKKSDTPENQFPKGIYDYWSCYDSQKTNKNIIPNLFVEYLRKAFSEFKKTNEKNIQIEWIAKGIRCLLNETRKTNFIPLTSNLFLSLIKLLDESSGLQFRKIIKEISEVEKITEQNWPIVELKVKKILGLFKMSCNEKTKEFMVWSEDKEWEKIFTEDQEERTFQDNIFTYVDEASNRSVKLEFGSIHSVKGGTHLATLVLETFNRTHNIKAILKYLCGNQPKKKNDSDKKRLRCQYVAMSRARGLICLAIPLDFVDDAEKTKLLEMGWNIKEVI